MCVCVCLSEGRGVMEIVQHCSVHKCVNIFATTFSLPVPAFLYFCVCVCVVRGRGVMELMHYAVCAVCVSVK